MPRMLRAVLHIGFIASCLEKNLPYALCRSMAAAAIATIVIVVIIVVVGAILFAHIKLALASSRA